MNKSIGPMSLEEYAKKHPCAGSPAASPEPKGDIKVDRSAIDEAAKASKKKISSLLAEGASPQLVLYEAVYCIGLLTDDEEWTAGRQQALDDVYQDLAQESLLRDTAGEALARVDALKMEYIEKEARRIENTSGNLAKVQSALKEAKDALESMIRPSLTGESPMS